MISRDDILVELRPLWAAIIGSDREVAGDTRIVQWLKDEGLWEEMDVAEFVLGIRQHFGVSIPQAEWLEFWGAGVEPEIWEREIEPAITFARLADLILAQFPSVSFEPVEICGRQCGPAGAFVGLRVLAESSFSGMPPFAPSSGIKETFRGRNLHCYWSQLRVLTRNAVPPLSNSFALWALRLGVLTMISGLSLLLGICTVDVHVQTYLLLMQGFGFAALVTLILVVLSFLARHRPPKELRAFRQLAEHISATHSC